MESYTLWNVWIQLSNRQDREFVVNATPTQIEELRDFLANRQYVMSYDIGQESGDMEVNDLQEELGQWIADEIE